VALALVTVACRPAGDVPAADDRSPLVPTYDPAVADLDVADAVVAAPSPVPDEPTPADHGEGAAPDAPPGDGAVPAAEEPRRDQEDPRHPAPDTPTVDADDASQAPSSNGPAEARTVTSSVADPRGDTTKTLLGAAPAWADLVAGTVTRTGTGDVTLTVELAAPPSSPQRGTTMNVASFHDLTGDGHVDLEVWANWSDAGWFPSWRDNRAGRAAYGRDTGINVRAQDATLELTIPAERFGAQDRWRWSLGLEWGRHEWLGTAAAAHDLAPDEGAVAHTP
jgi:hypothetical protein